MDSRSRRFKDRVPLKVLQSLIDDISCRQYPGQEYVRSQYRPHLWNEAFTWIMRYGEAEHVDALRKVDQSNERLTIMTEWVLASVDPTERCRELCRQYFDSTVGWRIVLVERFARRKFRKNKGNDDYVRGWIHFALTDHSTLLYDRATLRSIARSGDCRTLELLEKLIARGSATNPRPDPWEDVRGDVLRSFGAWCLLLWRDVPGCEMIWSRSHDDTERAARLREVLEKADPSTKVEQMIEAAVTIAGEDICTFYRDMPRTTDENELSGEKIAPACFHDFNLLRQWGLKVFRLLLGREFGHLRLSHCLSRATESRANLPREKTVRAHLVCGLLKCIAYPRRRMSVPEINDTFEGMTRLRYIDEREYCLGLCIYLYMIDRDQLPNDAFDRRNFRRFLELAMHGLVPPALGGGGRSLYKIISILLNIGLRREYWEEYLLNLNDLQELTDPEYRVCFLRYFAYEIDLDALARARIDGRNLRRLFRLVLSVSEEFRSGLPPSGELRQTSFDKRHYNLIWLLLVKGVHCLSHGELMQSQRDLELSNNIECLPFVCMRRSLIALAKLSTAADADVERSGPAHEQQQQQDPREWLTVLHVAVDNFIMCPYFPDMRYNPLDCHITMLLSAGLRDVYWHEGGVDDADRTIGVGGGGGDIVRDSEVRVSNIEADEDFESFGTFLCRAAGLYTWQRLARITYDSLCPCLRPAAHVCHRVRELRCLAAAAVSHVPPQLSVGVPLAKGNSMVSLSYFVKAHDTRQRSMCVYGNFGSSKVYVLRALIPLNALEYAPV